MFISVIFGSQVKPETTVSTNLGFSGILQVVLEDVLVGGVRPHFVASELLLRLLAFGKRLGK